MEQTALVVQQRGIVPRIRSMMLNWLGVPVELTNHKFWAEFGQHQSHSGENVTVAAALRVSAVWACVRLLAETISTLPLMLYQRVPERQVAVKHPLYVLLHDNPNADMTAVTFWEVMLASMLLWGNGYAYIHRSGKGSNAVITALEFLVPDGVTFRRLPSGAIQYRWRDIKGVEQLALDTEVLHIPAFTIDGICGLSPVGYACNVLGAAISAERASGNVFRRGLMMAGTFETPNVVQEKHREAFQQRLDGYRSAMNAGTAPLLEAGITYKSLAINPNDAQLLETRAFSIEEICRWFRVPPFMVGHSEKSTSWGTGIEQQNIGFLTYAMRPWLKRVEQAVNRKLLTPAERTELYSEFNFEALLRADSAGRASFYSVMVQNGIYTRNEVRAKENLPSVDGADELTAQVNLAPLDKLGQAPPAPPPPVPQKASALNILVGMPEQVAPQVTMHHNTPINVRTPDVRVSAPTVNVAPAEVTVAAAQAPNVDVHMSEVRVESPVTVNLPEQDAPRVTIHQAAQPTPPAALPAPASSVEFTFDDDGNVTGAKLK